MSGSAQLTVTAAVTVSISVASANAQIPVGASQQYTAMQVFSDGTAANVSKNATWASANNAVATISKSGAAKAVGAGSSTISAAAMTKLNDADVLIFDLRDNRGGFPRMVSLLAAYLFDHPEYMYCPLENTTAESWTRSPVPGNKLASKPVYILTSSRTISAAEQFTYDLKMLKRAMLVGETTAGGGHAANLHSVGDHFYVGTIKVRAINPYAKRDWNEMGIEPDFKVNASDAVHAALRLVGKRLHVE